VSKIEIDAGISLIFRGNTLKFEERDPVIDLDNERTGAIATPMLCGCMHTVTCTVSPPKSSKAYDTL
jgi:hypothetical protein